MAQSHITFNRVPERVPEKVWEALVQSQVRFNRVWEKVPKKVWCRARSGSTGFQREGSGEGLGEFGAGKICKNDTLRLLGIPPKLTVFG